MQIACVSLNKLHIGVLANLKVLASEPGHILDDERPDLAVFHHVDELFPRRPIEICTRITVVREEDRIFESIVLCILLQDVALVNDAI